MQLKRFSAATIIAVISLVSVAANEVSLFNQKGEPVAYIDTSDEYTIYLWSGEPAAYLTDSTAHGSLAIYGFNGKLLGWYVDGAIYDKRGCVAGFVKGSCPLLQSHHIAINQDGIPYAFLAGAQGLSVSYRFQVFAPCGAASVAESFQHLAAHLQRAFSFCLQPGNHARTNKRATGCLQIAHAGTESCRNLLQLILRKASLICKNSRHSLRTVISSASLQFYGLVSPFFYGHINAP